MWGKEDSVDEQVKNAVLGHLAIRFSYTDSKGDDTTRTVIPYRVVQAKDGSTHAVCRSCGDMHQDIYGGYQEFVLAYQWVMASVYHADVHRWVQTAMHAHTAYVQHNLITETDEMRVLDMAEHAAGMDY